MLQLVWEIVDNVLQQDLHLNCVHVMSTQGRDAESADSERLPDCSFNLRTKAGRGLNAVHQCFSTTSRVY